MRTGLLRLTRVSLIATRLVNGVQMFVLDAAELKLAPTYKCKHVCSRGVAVLLCGSVNHATEGDVHQHNGTSGCDVCIRMLLYGFSGANAKASSHHRPQHSS